MPTEHDPALLQHTDPEGVTPQPRQQMITCWIDVTNDGGAAGFPFPPVDEHQVAPVTDALINSLDPRRTRLLLAMRDDALAGWVILHHDPNPVIAHWGSVKHLQTHPTHRGQGIGTALMHELRRVARDEMGLEQLHLAVRAGMGLESFYDRLGWREVGRWPNALRLAPDDTRDEVLMALTPLRPAQAFQQFRYPTSPEQADMTLKENAIAKGTPPAIAAQGRCQPPDLVLAFLDAL